MTEYYVEQVDSAIDAEPFTSHLNRRSEAGWHLVKIIPPHLNCRAYTIVWERAYHEV